MKLKIVTSVVFTFLLCSILAYNSATVKADTNIISSVPQFAGYLYSFAGCQDQSELLSGVSYIAENRTSGITSTGVTTKGKWNVQNVQVGDLVKVTFTLNGKIGCILQQQIKAGYVDLKVCMTNSNACPYEW